jgi:hypothetical protein
VEAVASYPKSVSVNVDWLCKAIDDLEDFFKVVNARSGAVMVVSIVLVGLRLHHLPVR